MICYGRFWPSSTIATRCAVGIKQGCLSRHTCMFPEVHPVTKEEYHEREDDAHVLKVRVHVCWLTYSYLDSI